MSPQPRIMLGYVAVALGAVVFVIDHAAKISPADIL
jgi:hypothetical protein